MRWSPNPYLLLLLAPLLWAGNSVVTRGVVSEELAGAIPPITLHQWRWSIAVLVLLPFAVGTVIRHWDVVRKHLGLVLFLALTGIAGYGIFNYMALTTITAINGVLVFATTPVVTPIFAFFLFRETVTVRQAAGILISFIGLGVIVTRADMDILLGLKFTPGDLWILASVLVWALYSLYLRRLPRGLSGIGWLWLIAAVSLLFSTPLYAWEYTQLGGFEWSWRNGLAVFYVAIFPAILSYLAWNKGVEQVGATKASLFVHTMPVFAAVLSWVFLGEGVKSFHLAGAAFIFTGLYLTTVSSSFAGLLRIRRGP